MMGWLNQLFVLTICFKINWVNCNSTTDASVILEPDSETTAESTTTTTSAPPAPTTPSVLCPQGYWPAEVNTSGGIDGTDRTYDLLYQKNAPDPVCQFCPNVGCYIVRLPSPEPTQTKTENNGKSTLSPSTTTTVASTTTTLSTFTTISDLLTGLDQNDTIAMNNLTTSDSKTHESLYMSCDPWNKLPEPERIVSYLDCVMIGSQTEYYLFIYEPRFRESKLPPVDCINADFLSWIPNGTELLGLELGFKMRSIPPYLFRYHQRIMQMTQYICIDGSSLENHSIPFEDTERFASNRLTQVVFRSTELLRERRPPKAPDGYFAAEFHSTEEVQLCPFIVQHKPANITANEDCQFSPSALPTTSDKVTSIQAAQRCPFKQLIEERRQLTRRRKPHTGLAEELNVPQWFLSACLLVVVILLTFGIIIAFCAMNHQKLMLCRSRSSKRKEREAALALELAEQASKEAAAAAAAEAQQQQQQQAQKFPIYARYGMMPPNMGGAFGAFAVRPMDFPSSNNQANMGGAANSVRPGGAGGYYSAMNNQMH